MKKFGFNKKGRGDDDSGKAELFGGASSRSQSANPYAAMGAGGNDPYAPQSSAPPAYDGGMSDYRRDKSPVPPGGYGGGPPNGSRYGNSGIGDNGGPPSGSRYGNSGIGDNGGPPSGSRYGTSGVNDGGSRYGNSGPSYGEQGGYGSNRFGDDQQGGYGGSRYGTSGIQESMQSRRPGGYGGMGMNKEETQQAQGALFGDAPSRYQARSAPPKEDEGSSAPAGYGSQPGGYGSSTGGGYGDGEESQGYGSYGNRELTQEEQEEEDINATVWTLVATLALQWLLIAP